MGRAGIGGASPGGRRRIERTSAAVDTPWRTAFLESVERGLDERLRVDPDADDARTEVLIDGARHLVLAGGKRARPWMTMLLGEALGVDGGGLRDLAICVEMIHAASLLHDDVVDEGRVRRGHPTANARFGNLAAVLAGDLLLTIALQQLNEHPPALHRAAVGTVAEMTRATIREAAGRGRVDLEPERWRTIAAGKTGALFALCGRGAGLLSGDEATARRLHRAGLHLGIAFQMADDLDDVLGRSAGKDAFADLRNRNPNYTVIVAAMISGDLRDALRDAWAADGERDDELAAIGRAVIDTGALEVVWRELAREVELAEEQLEPWRGDPSVELITAWARGLRRRARPDAGGACAVS